MLTRIIRGTKAEPQPCAAAWFRDRDSNPNRQLQGLSSCRLDDPGSRTRGGTRTRRRRILSASALPVSVTRACATRDSNPDFTD